MRTPTIVPTLACALALAACWPARAEPGITAAEIRLGQSAAFSGAVAPQVKELTSGALAHFADVNRRGGVHGRRIVLESLDDAFDPKRAAENTRKLIHEKNVFSLFLYRATPTTEAAMPIIAEAKVPLVGPSTGAQSMYSPSKRYLFPVRPSYHAETIKVIDQLAAMGLTRIAILHADDAFGNDGLSGYSGALKAHQLEAVAVASYPRGTVKVGEAVAKIARAQPQAVVMVCAANAGAAFIKQMRKLGGSPQFVLLSNVSSQAFIQDLGADGRGVAVSQVGPWPFSVDTPLVKEYQAAMKAHDTGGDFSYSSLEGYIAAKVMVEGLKRSGPAPTREKLVAALESMARHDLGGVNLQYSPTDRTGTTYVELSIIGRNGRFIR